MPAGTYDISIDIGVGFDFPVIYRDKDRAAYDLTGYGAEFILRGYPGGPVILTATVANTKITVDPNVALAGTATKTAGSRVLAGTATNFHLLERGDTISVPGGSGAERRRVDSIPSSTQLIVDRPFFSSASAQAVTEVMG